MNLFFILVSFVLIHHVEGEKIHGRIFNGSEAPIHAYPWMVSIRFNLMNLIKRDCGGVIISDTFILTAASCFQNLTTIFVQYFTVKAGIHNIGPFIEPKEQMRLISQLIVHPNYTANHFYLNDLALIRVSPPFQLDKLSVYPIELSNLTSVKNMNLTTIGWGESNRGIIPIPLRQVIVQEDIECTQSKAIDPNIQLCASGTCLGDTGGPLMIYSNEHQQYQLVGITSYRDACMTDGLFTRVAPFIDLIMTVVKTPPSTSSSSSPPPRTTIPTLPSTTTPPDALGPPITFVCNTSYSCGCSSVPVIFHDEFPDPPIVQTNPLKIVGGETAQAHSWSWAVSLRRPLKDHFCGGSIIHNEWILTAAHCAPTTSTIVHIGVHDEKLPSPEIRNVIEVIVHPDFIPAPKYLNDIALLRISPPINFTTSIEYASPSCLPPKHTNNKYPEVNTRLAVIGWGKIFFGGPRATKLRQVRVKTLNNHDWRCKTTSFDTNRQFCAMIDGGGKDSCQGDSGGPIHQWLDDHWEQVGIVSFGFSCADRNHPGIYTRLSFYYDWIQSYINVTNPITDTSSISTAEPIFTSSIATTEPIFTSYTIYMNSTVDNIAVIHKTKLFFYIIMCVGGLIRFFFDF